MVLCAYCVLTVSYCLLSQLCACFAVPGMPWRQHRSHSKSLPNCWGPALGGGHTLKPASPATYRQARCSAGAVQAASTWGSHYLGRSMPLTALVHWTGGQFIVSTDAGRAGCMGWRVRLHRHALPESFLRHGQPAHVLLVQAVSVASNRPAVALLVTRPSNGGFVRGGCVAWVAG